MYNRIICRYLLILLLLSTIGCKGEQLTEYSEPLANIEDLSEVSFTNISSNKIYFGHQSVGYNIINGIKDVLEQESQINICIVETHSESDFASPVFAHSRIGRNTDPISKIDEFSSYIERGIGKKTDIIFLKLCYVDLNTLTNIEEVFENYRSSMSILSQKYPETTIMHFTVPLVARETGIKAAIKKLIGRSLRGYDDNIVRERYNEMIRKEYIGKEPLFDIALIESTRSDGKREVYQKEGKKYYALLPEYTDDGGHLNEKGRRIVAEQLLIELARIVKQTE